MNRSTLAILGLAVVAGAFGLWLGQRSAAPPPVQHAPLTVDTIAIGQRLPDTRLPDLDGVERDIDAWAGTLTVINFWASWCAPCIEEMPILAAFHTTHDDAQVLTIALDRPELARAFLDELGVDLPALVAEPGPLDLSVRLGNSRGVLPYTVVVDADWKLRERHLGKVDRALLEAWRQRHL
ncbi:MAG TPA: TlpA disulfide reductase family protein [Xanthomonadaceae bacterium]|nr:TlpA disulfide reductase family protein [Xanthomonadaceae bacterium]